MVKTPFSERLQSRKSAEEFRIGVIVPDGTTMADVDVAIMV
jgi:hypothetical protein